MLQALSLLSRPLGLAFGIFIVLNLALALQRPTLAITSIWLDASLPEPWLSLFAGVLGVALFVPHSMGNRSWIQWGSAGVFAGFAILVLAGAALFSHRWHSGEIITDFPLPMSAFVFVILLLEFIRVMWWVPRARVTPPPARVFLTSLAVIGAFFLLTLVHVVTYGRIDFRQKADAIVVFGAKVYDDGRPCGALRDRLDTALELFRQGFAPYVVMTGARDPNGWSEPAVMRDYVVEHGIPASCIVIDETGLNTRASAVGCHQIAERCGFHRMLAVTQFFHCARVKMIFEREGVPCFTVPTCSLEKPDEGGTGRLSRETFFVLRETIAFPFYLLYYR